MKNKMPEWVKKIRKNQHYFDGANSVLETLWHARGGGRLSKGLAGLSAIGKVINLVYPNPNPWGALREQGLTYRHMSISGFIAKTLLINTEPILLAAQEDAKALIWKDSNGRTLLGLYVSGSSSDLFIAPEGGDEFLRDLLQVVWADNNELLISRTATRDIILTKMQALGPYIGDRQPEYYIKRLSKYKRGPRTILLRGPTGVGKSVLGRHISRGLGRENSKTLKISSKVLKACDESEVLSMVEWFKPTVLILDDLELDSSYQTESFLALLESLRDPDTLVIVTQMTSHNYKEKPPTKGSWHFPGMRPGRIEETFTLYLPTKSERIQILQYYADESGFKIRKNILKKVAKKTKGLSGAYLGAVIERLETFGMSDWKSEVDHILYMAPFPEEEKEDNPPGKAVSNGAKTDKVANKTEPQA